MNRTKKINPKQIVESFVESRQKKTSQLQLQKRDLEIMRFILEQKFASLEMIYECHFRDRSAANETPKNYWTVRQRLAKLRKNGLLKTKKVPAESKGLFLITRLGLVTLEAETGKSYRIRESKRIDFSLYDHDSKLGMLRALLTARGKCRRWWSEKILRAEPIPVVDRGRRFDKELIPDAVFINSKGERIALELEVSRKGPAKIRDKVYRYSTTHLFDGHVDKVWIITTKPAISRAYKKVLADMKDRDKSRFRVDSWEKVVANDKD